MKYYLYNNLANNGIKTEIEGVQLIDASKIDYQDFFNKLNKEDEVVIVGGDGTINYFINHVDTDNLKNNVYIYGGGSGNDFLNDIEEDPGKEVLINEYLKNLPIATVNGKKIKYVNNVGVGLDGYICVVAERTKEKSPKKRINYTTIAISSLLFHFKPVSVEIEVDGNKYHYDNVWLAPTMKGRFYGGGMMIAPGQRRNEDFLSVIVYSCKSKINRSPLSFNPISVLSESVGLLFFHLLSELSCSTLPTPNISKNVTLLGNLFSSLSRYRGTFAKEYEQLYISYPLEISSTKYICSFKSPLFFKIPEVLSPILIKLLH